MATMPLTNPPSSGSMSGPISFFGATPTSQKGPFVNTYSSTNWTLGAYTPNVQSSAYTGGLLDLTQALRLNDGNLLRVALENLRALAENTAQQHNALVSDLKAYGLIS